MHMEIEKDCTSRRLFLSPFVTARPQGSPHPQKHLIHNRLIDSNTQLTIIDKLTIIDNSRQTSTIYKSLHPKAANILDLKKRIPSIQVITCIRLTLKERNIRNGIVIVLFTMKVFIHYKRTLKFLCEETDIHCYGWLFTKCS